MSYCIYLRKSRADAEAEARGEGETLKRHEETLLSLAKKMSLPITKIYKEIVSGETISARPQMQALLNDVSDGKYKGVLVMEIERLARGNTLDQGIVSQAFQLSGTEIVTPLKTYDPNNEFDEEYFEFGLFMSRREYKTINRRIQRGRETAFKEGKWIYSTVPYGLKRVKLENDSGYTLEPAGDDSTDAVLLIKEMTINKLCGSSVIARELNTLGYKPAKGDYWTPGGVRQIRDNIIYAGYQKKGERKYEKYIENGEVKYRRRKNPDCLIVKSLFEGLYSLEDYEKMKEISTKNIITSTGIHSVLKNPLAGLIVCGKCGKVMQRQELRKKNRKTQQRIRCENINCDNCSSNFEAVETALIEALESWLAKYKPIVNIIQNGNKTDKSAEAIQRLEKEKETVNKQISKLHDLLEQGIYDADTFLSRNKILSEKIETINNSINEIKSKSKKRKNIVDIADFVQQVESVVSAYYTMSTAKEKNQLLKTVLHKAVYFKNKKGIGFKNDLEIEIYPKIEENFDI